MIFVSLKTNILRGWKSSITVELVEKLDYKISDLSEIYLYFLICNALYLRTSERPYTHFSYEIARRSINSMFSLDIPLKTPIKCRDQKCTSNIKTILTLYIIYYTYK